MSRDELARLLGMGIVMRVVFIRKKDRSFVVVVGREIQEYILKNNFCLENVWQSRMRR